MASSVDSQKTLDKINLSSFVYSLFQIAQGLIFHPYQTMQSLVREKVFAWMSFLPTIFLIILTLIWRYGIQTLILMFFPQLFDRVILVKLVKFLANWLIFFCLYWQMVLAYLLVRFYKAWKK